MELNRNMGKNLQQKNTYDSVFDFIFSVQKKKVNKPFPKPPPSAGVYASSLIEIGTQPAIYPLESAFNSINSYIQSASEIQLADGVKTDVGTLLTGGGNADIKKGIARQRAKANFARIGGDLHSGIDGALVSLLAKFNGASAKTAYKTGKLFADVKRKELKVGMGGKYLVGGEHLFGYRTKDDIRDEEQDLYDRGLDLTFTSMMQLNPSLNKNFLKQLVNNTNQNSQYRTRIQQVDTALRMHGISNPHQRMQLARFLYGTGVGNDLGAYRQFPETEQQLFGRVLYSGSSTVKNSIPKKDRELLETRISYRMQEKQPTKRQTEIFKVLNNSGLFSPRQARLMAQDLAKDQITNTGRDVAKNAIGTSLVMNIPGVVSSNARLNAARNSINNILIPQQLGQDTLGAGVARGLLAYDWIKNSGAWGDIFLSGNWAKFGNEDLNFTNIVEKKTVVDSDTGKEIGSYYTSANSVMGKIIGDAYYLHPNNLIGGLFIDGSLLLKWANKDGKLNKKSFAYLLYQARLGRMFQVMAKPFQFLTKGIVEILKPLAEGIKKFARNVLRKILGATGIGGWIVDRLLDLIGDQLLLVIAQIAQTIVLALVAALLLLLSPALTTVSDGRIQEHLSSPEEEIIVSQDENTFTEDDFIYLSVEESLQDLKQEAET